MALTDFLRARLTEDIAAAEVAIGFLGTLPHSPGGWSVEGVTIWEAHRAAADLDAKARIVQHYDRSTTAQRAIALLPVLRFLALPYADHPDYRDEWKP